MADQVANGSLRFDQAMRIFCRIVAKNNLRMKHINIMLESFDRRLVERGYLPRAYG